MKKPKYPEFVKVNEKDDPVFKLGMKFGSIEDLKKAIRQHAILNGKDILFKRSERYRVRAYCRPPCEWMIYGALIKGELTCQGTTVEQYDKLRDYCEELRRANPGSTIELKTEDGDCKCDALMNNWCEAFNGAIVHAKDNPILTMLEMIRSYLMNKLSDKRDWIKKALLTYSVAMTEFMWQLNQSSNRPGQVHVAIAEEVVQPRMTTGRVSIRPPLFTFQGRRYMTREVVEAAVRRVRTLRNRGRDAAKKPWK
ncbi:hypothetical protein RJ639_030644 [Escallonia herrerae]|uniref:Transposase MuDR plant domain-containing protein n=1 Tax=Escallonia herrerae TaxID=1293975 RepID=A0AA88XD87_9ASTE|nr:hypothetical protein RJ639_030644 [Escallonia herrerae]